MLRTLKILSKNSFCENKKGADKDKDSKKEAVKTTIEINGFENRVEMLEIDPGNLGNLTAIENKLLFIRSPNAGSPKGSSPSLN